MIRYLQGAVGATVLLASTACAALPMNGTYIGADGQIARMETTEGERHLVVTAGGDESRGAGVQGDCQLRAKESRASKRWHLVPFVSDTMDVRESDIQGVAFELKAQSPNSFELQTDYAERNCAAGMTFTSTYRQK